MTQQLTTLEEFGKAFIPKSIRPGIRRYMAKAGYSGVPYKIYGILFMLSVAVTAFAYILFIFPLISDMNSLVFMVLTFILWFITQSLVILVIVMVLYIRLDMKIYRRTKKMEAVIEDFLRYVSENLKGGMTFEKALWQAIRPQYGVLSDEIGLVAKRVMTGTDIKDALIEFTDKYDSPMIKRSFQLIVEGMKGGGNIAYIIDRVEKDIRESKELKKEMSAANTTYVIFMVFIVLIIAPGLFGLSYNLLMVLKNIAGTISQATGGGSGGSMDLLNQLSDVSINPQSFKTFSFGALSIISLFASMIISIIQNGNIKEGLKYMPVFIMISLVMYIFFRSVLSVLFAGMM